MILPITLPSKSPPNGPALPTALARLGSSELVLLELQGELDVSGDKHGQLVGRLTIDDDGKVRALPVPISPPKNPFSFPLSFPFFLGCVRFQGQADAADRPPPLGGQDRQLAQAAGRVAARMCAAAATKFA
jgi:hypothetical protein